VGEASSTSIDDGERTVVPRAGILGQRGDVGEESRDSEGGRTVGGVREGRQGEEWGVPSPGNRGFISMGIITCSVVRGGGGGPLGMTME